MPNYDYKCDICYNVQTEFHGVNEEPEIHCNECQYKMNKVFIKAPLMKMKAGHAWDGFQTEDRKRKRKR